MYTREKNYWRNCQNKFDCYLGAKVGSIHEIIKCQKISSLSQILQLFITNLTGTFKRTKREYTVLSLCLKKNYLLRAGTFS